jgi:hypothetical protein
MSELAQGDKLSVATLNTKMITIQSGAPSTTYDGMVWVCVSSNPPLVQVRDETNSAWLKHGETRYEVVNSGGFPSSGVYLPGTLSVNYDQQQSTTVLFAYANSSWRNMGGTITRIYPVGDKNVNLAISGGESQYTSIERRLNGTSGSVIILGSTNITPSNSGDFLAAFVGGCVYPYNAANTANLRLFVGTTQVGSQALTVGAPRVALASGLTASNTSTNVYTDIYFTISGSFATTGLGFAAITVKT